MFGMSTVETISNQTLKDDVVLGDLAADPKMLVIC